jgi:hypothetical protein
MSGWHVRTFKTRRIRAKGRNGEVSNMQLKRDCERGIEYFYSKRPWLQAPVPSFGPGRRVLRARLGLDEAVRVAVAIGQPMRGALKAIADTNGLDYAAFMKAYYKAKKAAAPERRACA